MKCDIFVRRCLTKSLLYWNYILQLFSQFQFPLCEIQKEVIFGWDARDSYLPNVCWRKKNSKTYYLLPFTIYVTLNKIKLLQFDYCYIICLLRQSHVYNWVHWQWLLYKVWFIIFSKQCCFFSWNRLISILITWLECIVCININKETIRV